MQAFQVGRIVVKTAGREALQKAVIVNIIDHNFVLITGAGVSKVKRRRANVKHLIPQDKVLDIPVDASDEQVKEALEKEGLIEDFQKPLQL